MKKFGKLFVSMTLACAMVIGLAACGQSGGEPAESEAAAPETAEMETEAGDGPGYAVDCLVLVNKENPLPENWEEEVDIVTTTNSLGDEVQVEGAAYDAYLALKAALEEEGVYVDLDSAYRSVAEQQRKRRSIRQWRNLRVNLAI